MPELLVDFITSLDGYASAEGWPGFWGLQGPEYLAWLGEQPEATYLMGANTYRLMSGFAGGETPPGTDEFNSDEEASLDGLTRRRRSCSPTLSKRRSRGPTQRSCEMTRSTSSEP